MRGLKNCIFNAVNASAILLAVALPQNGPVGHEKCIFETPHNEIKCVLSIIESYSIEKNGSKFSHLLTVKAKVADPLPLMVSLTVKYPLFFYTFL